MTAWSDLLRRTSLRRQLTAVAALGIFGLALFSSLAISWQSASRVRATLLEQGQQAAANLARQSRLALIYDAPENAAEAIKLTLAFPGIVGLEIRHADGRVLLARGPVLPAPVRVPTAADLSVAAGMLESEQDDTWTFVAPVADAAQDSPFDIRVRPQAYLGYARVLQSKETLQRMRTDVFLVNSAVSFLLATVVLVLIHVLTSRLTRPLLRLSETMNRADAGVTGLVADETGPREITTMARAFNKMMAVLAEGDRQLRDARDDALAFARTKADFAATVSHEIRTPLNGVIGTLDMLKIADMPTAQRQLLDQAWNSSLYLLDLINDILDLSRLEAGKLACEVMPFDLLAAIEDVVALLSPQAAGKGLDFGYFIADGVPARVCGDPRRLRQILVNLAGNAIKFTPRGGVEIVASVSVAESGRDPSLRFEVVDTGIGIDEDIQQAIFEWFTQADAATTRQFGGSGLGLAICKRLVGLLGGRIGVRSHPDAGSCFWFEVPLLAADSQPWPDAPAWSGRRALIGESSPQACRYLRQVLGRWGFDVLCADGEGSLVAQAASAFALGQPIDVAIIAAALVPPGSDLPDRLRHACPGVRLLLTQPRPFFGARETWADAELAKPFRQDPLRQALGRALDPGLAAGVDVPPQSAAGTAGFAGREFAGRRILVVEDDRTSQEVVAGMLAMLGVDAGVASDGLQGLAAIRHRRWDAVLLDCSMPGMDGYQVAAAIRAEQPGGQPHLPVIALTAHAYEADIARCRTAGMDDYLAKPLTLDRLQDCLRTWLGPIAPAGHTVAAAQDTGAESAMSVLDPHALARLRHALGDALTNAVHAFVSDMPVYLARIEQAADGGDGATVRDAAHSIRGAAGNLGARALATIAGRMECAADDPATLAHLLIDAHAACLAASQALLAGLKPTPDSATQAAAAGTGPASPSGRSTRMDPR